MKILPEDLEKLKHTLGIGPDAPRKLWGYRNFYDCGTPYCPSDTLHAMRRLEQAGLVRQYESATGRIVFAATLEGCKKVGLTGDKAKEVAA